MTTTVALLATAAQKDAITGGINALTPDYTVGFARKVAAINPAMLWSQPATHWYANASGVPDEVLMAWQDYAASAVGLVLFVAINADNPLGWAVTNLTSQGLQFVPAQELD